MGIKRLPDETKEAVMVLWNLGYSATEVGVSTGMTRNAVIGIAHRNRHKYPPRGNKAGREKLELPALKIVPVPRAGGKKSVKGKDKKLAEDLGPETGTLLVDLDFDQCRFPVHYAKGRHRFCGAKTVKGKSWCTAHHKKVFILRSQYR
jgi:hypothetical protein